MKCPCFLYDEGEEPGVCECGHMDCDHEPAPGGHPGECTADID